MKLKEMRIELVKHITGLGTYLSFSAALIKVGRGLSASKAKKIGENISFAASGNLLVQLLLAANVVLFHLYHFSLL